MKKIKLGSGFTVFVLFFGISLLDAFRSGQWGRAALWLVLGIIFLLADNMKRYDS